MPTLALLSPKVWLELGIAALLVALAWYGYDWVYDRGANSVQVKWDAEKLDQAQQSAKIASDALATTKSLQNSADEERKAKNAQIASLNTKLGVAIAGLRDRPSRPSSGDLPKSTGTGTVCTGAGLYRDDGEFLVRLASRAKALDIKLASCEADYARVAAQINGK